MGSWAVRTLVLLGTLFVFGFPAAAADAATVSKSGTALSYTAGAGEENGVTLSVDLDGHLILEDDGVSAITIGSGSGCATSGADNVLDCGVPVSGETVDISTGDGADSITIDAQIPIASVTVDAGAGDDTINGGDGTETLLGGDGNDTITSYGGNDTIDAGNQDDTIFAADSTADVINCGAGTDEVDADNVDTINDCEQDTTGTTLTDPTATSLAASGVSTSAATLNGSVNPSGHATHYHFQWGASTDYGNTTTATTLATDSNDHSVSADLSSLQLNKTYHYRVVVTAADAPTVVGDDQTFTTNSLPAPSATTAAAPSSLHYNSATLNGTANGQGLTASYVYEWGKTTSYGNVTPSASVPNDGQDHAVPADISGLSPSTTYHYQLVVNSNGGTTFGGDKSFKTPARPNGPIEAIADVQGVPVPKNPNKQAVGVRVEVTGLINGNNLPVTYHVEYGPTTAYGSRTADQSAGASTGDTTVVIDIDHVPGGQEEHYKLVATNSQGTTGSDDFVFKTEDGPFAPECEMPGDPQVVGHEQEPVLLPGKEQCALVTSVGTTTASIQLPAFASETLSYGLSTAYGQSVSASSSTTGYVTVTLTGLSPGTVYHASALLRNLDGKHTTPDFIFITSPDAGAKSATASVSTGTAIESVACSTKITCTGSVTIETVPLGSVAARSKKTKKPTVIAKGGFKIPAHKKGKVRLKLTRAGKKLLKHKHTLKVEQITTSILHGHKAYTVKTITLHVH